MEKTANKQKICEVLLEAAQKDKNIVALCSDSRGSGSFTPFAEKFPEQDVYKRQWLGRFISSSDCAVFLCYTGILRIFDDELYRRNSARA